MDMCGYWVFILQACFYFLMLVLVAQIMKYVQKFGKVSIRGERDYLEHGAKLDNEFFFILACKNTFCNR